MFDIGDVVYHPTNGAGVIKKLERMPAIEEDLRFYQIHMTDRNETVLRVPVSKADEIGLRRAIPRQEVEEILAVLASEPDELPDASKTRYQVCQKRLDTGDTRAIATVVRDLSWRSITADKLNSPAQRIFRAAKRLLAGELAIAQGISIEVAEAQIRDALKAQRAAV